MKLPNKNIMDLYMIFEDHNRKIKGHFQVLGKSTYMYIVAFVVASAVKLLPKERKSTLVCELDSFSNVVFISMARCITLINAIVFFDVCHSLTPKHQVILASG